MQTINGENKREKAVKIRCGKGRSIVLLFSDSHHSSWLQEEVLKLLRREDGIPVRSSPFATVLKFQNPETGEKFYFKEFHNRGLRDNFKTIFSFTRSRRAFKAGKLLSDLGFLTPVPIMYGSEKLFWVSQRNFLITKEVPGQRTYQYFESIFPKPLLPEIIIEKRGLIYAAGCEIGRLHKAGISHGDLRVGNIIIDGRGVSAQFFFIDNERTRYHKIIPKKKRIKNLIQLNMVQLPQITMTDRLRFFNAYLSENPALNSERKKLIMEVYFSTMKRFCKKS